MKTKMIKRKNRFFYLLLCLAVIPLFTGMGRSSEITEITIKDITGRPISLEKAPDRIVCIAPGTLRLILYLNAEDKVVGVEEIEKRYPDSRPYWMAYPSLSNLPTIGPGGPVSINKDPDLEAVLAVNPDLVFISYMERARADMLSQKLNIPVVVLSYGPFGSFDDTLYHSLRIVGKILDKNERAEAVIQFIESAIADLGSRTRILSRHADLTAYIGGIGWKGTQGIESTDARYAPFRWCHVTNIASDICREKGHCFINKEQLITLDPHIIFIDGGSGSIVKNEIEKKRPIYEALGAFREKRVFSLHPFNWYMTNIGTVLSDAYVVGKLLSPETFHDLDPAQKSDEIYRFFLGKPLYEKMARIYGPLGEKL